MTEAISHTIADACRLSGLGRTSIYELIGSGRIEAFKIGSRTLIRAESLRRYLESQPPAPIGKARKAA